MEEALQQEKDETEYTNPNEDQGGIGRRLRDRDLLRKRKAEAEEKETNEVESQRKRSRASGKSGAKRRGRPRKTEPTVDLADIQEEAAVSQEAPAVVAAPVPVAVTSEQTSGSVTLLLPAGVDKPGSQPDSVLTGPAPAPAPVFGSVQGSVLAPFLTSSAPLNQAPAPVSPPDPSPAPVQDSTPASDPVLALSQDPDSSAPAQIETLYTESQGRETLYPVLIEDLGPDEEEDISPPQEKNGDGDLSETPVINVPEQNKMFSISTLSSPPPPQEYLPGN